MPNRHGALRSTRDGAFPKQGDGKDMAFINGAPFIGTSGSDVLVGGSDQQFQTFNGVEGNDLFVGDQVITVIPSTSSFNSPISLDAVAFQTAPHPLVDPNAGPYISTYAQTTTGGHHFLRVTVAANQTLTVDTDFANFDTHLQLLDSQQNVLAANDDDPNNSASLPSQRSFGDPGSDGASNGDTDSHISFTPQVQTVVYIQVSAFDPIGGMATNIPAGGSTILNISYTGAQTTSLVPDSGVDSITGGAGDDILFGMAGNDILDGGADNDTIDGGLGTNTMDGGAGDEDFASYATFVPTSGTNGVQVFLTQQGSQQATGAGLDTLSNFEGLIGSDFDDGLHGDSGNNTLIGGKGDDTLSGLGGLDYLLGGDGNDIFFSGVSVGDVVANEVYDGGAGNDSLVLLGGAGTFNLRLVTLLNLETIMFTSNGGGAGLTGSKTVEIGANQLLGSGISNFQVNNDSAGEEFSVAIFMESTGSVDFSHISAPGFSEDDGDEFGIAGTSGNDTITGTNYADIIFGGGGDDELRGHSGNDLYFVDSIGDQVIENGLAFGDDTILSVIDFDIPEFVERLVMSSTANLETNGNDLANHITGNSGNNYINGGLGTDVMQGGGGNDTYTVDNLNDVIVELASDGDDAVYSEIDVQLSGNIETAILSPTFATAVSAFGDAGNNQLFGNEFANILYGRGGLDRMGGGGGDDIFVMAMGDQAANVQEQITDFEGAGIAGGDRMGFSGFGAGATVVQVGTSSYEVRDAGNVAQASFILEGVTTALTVDDYYFT